MSSSRIGRISQLKQKPQVIYNLDFKPGTNRNIQIQVTDFEEKLLLLNVEDNKSKLHLFNLDQARDIKEEEKEEINLNLQSDKKQGQDRQ